MKILIVSAIIIQIFILVCFLFLLKDSKIKKTDIREMILYKDGMCLNDGQEICMNFCPQHFNYETIQSSTIQTAVKCNACESIIPLEIKIEENREDNGSYFICTTIKKIKENT